MRRRQNVQEIIKKYHTHTEDFIDRFKSDLSVDEAELLRKKVKILRSAAKASKSKVRASRQFTRTPDLEIEDDRLNMEERRSEAEGSLPNCGIADDVTDLTAFGDPEFLGGKAENEMLCDQDLQVLTDQVVLILPEVPHEPGNDADHVSEVSGEEIDEQIRQRLIKLLFFSKAWAQNSSNSSSSPNPAVIEEITEVVIGDSKSSPEIEIIPMESTEQDRQSFNNWYYAKVDKLPDHHVRNDHFIESDFKCQSCLKTSPVLPTKTSSQDSLEMTNTGQKQGMDMVTTCWNQGKNLSNTWQDMDMVNTGQSGDTDSNSNPFNHKGSEQQELLDVITNLCYMQAYVVTMVITANIILNKLNMISSQLYGVHCHPEPGQTEPGHAELGHSEPGQAEPGQSEPVQEQEEPVQEVHVSSLNFDECWTLPPVKWKEIVFTMNL